jgi:magnesium chelatase family protein
MLVAAMNPCPCGYYNVAKKRCTCQANRVFEYHTRISGPLLDRIDITLQTREVPLERICAPDQYETPSSYYRDRVEAARDRQRHRLAKEAGVYCNAQLGPRLLRSHCKATWSAESNLASAMRKYGLSARAHDRILKLARTRADLEGHELIEEEDMRLAIDCRMLDRKGWLRPVEGASPIQTQFAKTSEVVNAKAQALNPAAAVAPASPVELLRDLPREPPMREDEAEEYHR